MINKDSLLDAYMSLSGSPTMHLAMLLVCLFVLRNPVDLTDEYYRDRLSDVYKISIGVHCGSFVIQ